MKRLLAAPSLAGEVERNARLLELPVRPVLEVYTGTFHEGFDAATLSPAARKRAARGLVVASALWGALRPVDRIPPYRLNICSRLVGMDRLEPAWRTVLPDVLAAAAGPRGVVFDVRSLSYQAIGMPAGLGDRTVVLRIAGDAAGGGRTRHGLGEACPRAGVRLLLESGEEPDDPKALAGVLAERWPVQLDPPARTGKPWTITLTASA